MSLYRIIEKHDLLRVDYIAFMSYISSVIRFLWVVLAPSWYAKYYYRRLYKDRLDLKAPKDYKEKVQWLKVYSDIKHWTLLADKYRVREYVESCGLGDILVKIYGAWKDARNINFELLPDKFVLKTNNGCGKNILVYDKKMLGIKPTISLLNEWIKFKQGLVSFEPHLWNIDRMIIAEELLEDIDSKSISASLIDYKFFCFHGEPYIINVLYDRKNKVVGRDREPGSPTILENVYDLKWNPIKDAYPDDARFKNNPVIPKPERLDEMITICRLLSKPFPQVRVDLYLVNGKVYFGEMTFTPGKMEEFSEELLTRMGERIDLAKADRRKGMFIV